MELSQKGIVWAVVLFGFFSLGAATESNKTDAKSPMLSQNELMRSPLAVTPEQNAEDADKIHEELKQIIVRTQQLQDQVRDDRNEIRQILERAQIHQKILKGMTLPKAIQSKQQINQEDILAREKMRLIAQQAYRTQEKLKAIQSAKAANSIPKTKIPQTS